MLVVHVNIQVKTEHVAEFLEATLQNAGASLLEPGVVRFDVAQQTDDPARFVLVEVYRDVDAPARHKQTAHYLTWRDRVESMMARPRESAKFNACFPEPAYWETPRATSGV